MENRKFFFLVISFTPSLFLVVTIFFLFAKFYGYNFSFPVPFFFFCIFSLCLKPFLSIGTLLLDSRKKENTILMEDLVKGVGFSRSRLCC
jgi:hypothetical protein